MECLLTCSPPNLVRKHLGYLGSERPFAELGMGGHCGSCVLGWQAITVLGPVTRKRLLAASKAGKGRMWFVTRWVGGCFGVFMVRAAR
jgi:hypothetical protein